MQFYVRQPAGTGKLALGNRGTIGFLGLVPCRRGRAFVGFERWAHLVFFLG